MEPFTSTTQQQNQYTCGIVKKLKLSRSSFQTTNKLIISKSGNHNVQIKKKKKKSIKQVERNIIVQNKDTSDTANS